jgi:NAD(P)-dependent dehydrogenase (short-subunit alcohol dehydrogenase family)
MQRSELSGRVAIVTGGAKGIGRATVFAMLQHGARVVIADRDSSAAEQTLQEISSPTAIFAACDISQPRDCEAVVADAIQQFGSLDVLANCAGIQTYGDVSSTTEEIWDRTMDVNLKGQWLMSKAALQQMNRGGAIIHVSSVQGLASQRNVLAYATSKHALIGLTRSMAVDLASFGIRVNCVCPGTVERVRNC